MDESLGFRIAAAGDLTADEVEFVRDYTTDVPVFASGAEAAAHGLDLLDQPPAEAVRLITKLARRRS